MIYISVCNFYVYILKGFIIDVMWARAVWTEGKKEEEGVIPLNWVEDNTIRWPNTLNVLKPLAERREPSPNWHRFPLVKIKMKSGRCRVKTKNSIQYIAVDFSF